MNATRWAGIVATTLTFAVSACASTGTYQSEAAGENAEVPRTVAVNVRNDNYWDMKLYAVVGANGMMRIGTVRGMTSEKFTVHRGMYPTGTLRLFASQLAGRGTADSGELQVDGGERVTFNIQPNLGASYAFVR